MLPETVALLGLFANPHSARILQPQSGHPRLHAAISRVLDLDDYWTSEENLHATTTFNPLLSNILEQARIGRLTSDPDWMHNTTSDRNTSSSSRAPPERSAPNPANNVGDRAPTNLQETWPMPNKMANSGVTGHPCQGKRHLCQLLGTDLAPVPGGWHRRQASVSVPCCRVSFVIITKSRPARSARHADPASVALPADVVLTHRPVGGRGASVPLAEAKDVAFELSGPARRIPGYRGQRNMPGWWWSATTRGHVVYESWLERHHLMTFDRLPRVTGIAGQPFAVSWSGWPAPGAAHPGLLRAVR